MTEQALKKEMTSHPYIIINKDVCDGSPIIAGTRTRVIDIAIEYEVLGRSPDLLTPIFVQIVILLERSNEQHLHKLFAQRYRVRG